MSRIVTVFLILLIFSPLAACTPYAAWNAPGYWQPQNVNANNLRAMVANPQDLTAGHGTVAAAGPDAVAPVEGRENLLAAGKIPVAILPQPSVSVDGGGGSGQ